MGVLIRTVLDGTLRDLARCTCWSLAWQCHSDAVSARTHMHPCTAHRVVASAVAASLVSLRAEAAKMPAFT